MTIQAPSGWNTFTGGGDLPALCGEDQTCANPPCGDVVPLSLLGDKPSLSCTLADYALDITITGGVPPFIVVSTAGFITITGTRSARLAIHELQNVIGFFRPLLFYIATVCQNYEPCLDTGIYSPENSILAEFSVDVRLRPFDCLGLEILPPGYPTLGGDPSLGPSEIAAPYAHPIGDVIADRTCTMAHDFGGQDVLTTDELSNDNTWSVQMSRCTTGVGSVSILVTATLAGKNGVNGTIHSAAPAYSEIINVPRQYTGLATDPPCHDASLGVSRLDMTNYLDVRTQSMIDAGCCVTPPGINVVVTVTDAAGTVAFLTVPVV